jgi:hypothetical protein
LKEWDQPTAHVEPACHVIEGEDIMETHKNHMLEKSPIVRCLRDVVPACPPPLPPARHSPNVQARNNCSCHRTSSLPHSPLIWGLWTATGHSAGRVPCLQETSGFRQMFIGEGLLNFWSPTPIPETMRLSRVCARNVLPLCSCTCHHGQLSFWSRWRPPGQVH